MSKNQNTNTSWNQPKEDLAYSELEKRAWYRCSEYWSGWDAATFSPSVIFPDIPSLEMQLTPGVIRKSYFIECKPSMGDDFPEVLRQCKGHMDKMRPFERGRRVSSPDYGEFKFEPSYNLLIGEFTGTTCTIEQVVKMFESSRIHVVTLADINDENFDGT